MTPASPLAAEDQATAEDTATAEDKATAEDATPTKVRPMTFSDASSPSVGERLSRSLSSLFGSPAQTAADAGLREALEEFLDATDLDFSSHIERASSVIEKLAWATADGPVKPSAAEVHANLRRSLDVFSRCVAAKDELSYRGKEIVQALQKRVEAYSGDAERRARTAAEQRLSTSRNSTVSEAASARTSVSRTKSLSQLLFGGGDGAATPNSASRRFGSLVMWDGMSGMHLPPLSDAPLRVLVLGGGPIGLRSAIEMAMLGHKVTLLEARDGISRLNVLKLWEETTIDLDRLSLKLIDSEYSNKKASRASTARLQLALLKVALLMGVHLIVDRGFEDFDMRTAQQHAADVLVVATGFRQQLLSRFKQQCSAFEYIEARHRSSLDDAADGGEEGAETAGGSQSAALPLGGARAMGAAASAAPALQTRAKGAPMPKKQLATGAANSQQEEAEIGAKLFRQRNALQKQHSSFSDEDSDSDSDSDSDDDDGKAAAGKAGGPGAAAAEAAAAVAASSLSVSATAATLADGARPGGADEGEGEAAAKQQQRGGASHRSLSEEEEGPFSRMPEASRPAAAIAVVAHFEASKRTPEAAEWLKAFEPFDWTLQDAMGADDDDKLERMQTKFGLYCIAPKRLREEGILLENMVAYANKGSSGDVPPSFYFIFTLKADMVTACTADGSRWKLIKPGAGMSTDGGSRALLEWAKSRAAADAGCGLDQRELERFAKRVAHIFTEQYARHTVKGGRVVEGGLVSASLPESCELLRTVDDRFPRSLDIFDFSERHMMRRAAEVVSHVDGVRLPRHLLVLPVGDALQEPFWPEGLGINRGMHNALDACWIADQWGAAQRDGELARRLVQYRQSLYEGKTLQMHGKNRSMLRGYRLDNSKDDSPKPAYSYTPNPETRYHMSAADKAPLVGAAAA